jgi:solute carrier family 25 carnitine/acylcarnitine transporter 20/29
MSTLQTVNELIAGSVGGAAQVLVGQPLDTVKTRAQIAPSLFLLMSNLRG